MDSQEQPKDDDTTDLPEITEISLLKERAKVMGIKHSPNIGTDALRQKIEDFKNGEKNLPQETEIPDEETKIQKRTRIRKSAAALVRCRIYNMNPQKRDWKGEFCVVANKYLSFKKMIPFGEQTDNGYHIPMFVYNKLKSQKFIQKSTRNVNGKIEVTTREVPEYAIEILPPLTEKELKDLATKQAAAQSLGG